MGNRIVTDKSVINGMEFDITESHISQGYQLVYPIGTINYYLCTDGSVREFAWLYHKDVAFYATRELAQEALDRFNKKEVVMKKRDLTSGMVLTVKDECNAINQYTVVLGHEQGDIGIRHGGYLRLAVFNDNLEDTGRNCGTYTLLKVAKPKLTTDFYSKDKSRYDVVWTRPVPVTTMTIAEIQEKLGIDNLHIKD